jgi:hypothetical protein
MTAYRANQLDGKSAAAHLRGYADLKARSIVREKRLVYTLAMTTWSLDEFRRLSAAEHIQLAQDVWLDTRL